MTAPRFGEAEIVERLVRIGWRGSRAVRLGPGDDAAFLRGGLVISTDLAVEGVHFRLDWIDAEEAGFRAAAAALSDMAAMGAKPEALLVSLAVPPSSPELAASVQRGVASAANRVEVAIVGGDLSRIAGPVVVDVVTVGRAHAVVTRNGAKPGHAVWVTGALGGAAAAVAAWSGGRSPHPAARGRFASPPNRVPVALELARRGLARSMIDISDGLVVDAGRVANASCALLALRRDLVPVHPGAEGDLKLALHGGEDYELMFTAHPSGRTRIQTMGRELSVQLTRIGTVVEGEGVVLEGREGRRTRPGRGGHDHFADPGWQRR